MAGKLEKSIEAVREILDTAVSDDEYCLVRFSDTPEIIASLANGPTQVAAAMHTIYPRGFTALLDAINVGIEEVQRGHNRHKAIVVISDGGDNRSVHTQQEIKQLVRETDVQVYSIGILVPETEMFSQEEMDGPGLLKGLSRKSGGHLFAIHEIMDLPTATAKINGALRHQYILGYYPKDAHNDGKYRHVSVRLHPPKGAPRLRASWRPGYYAPKQ
jgi:Ca-activated chloride channel homolog